MPFSSTSRPRIWLIASCRTVSIRKPISFIDSMTVSASTTTVPPKPEFGADLRGHAQREHHGQRADHQAGTRLKDDVHFARNIHAPDDAEDQIGQQAAAEQEGQDGDQVEFGIVAVIADGCRQNADQPGLQR